MMKQTERGALEYSDPKQRDCYYKAVIFLFSLSLSVSLPPALLSLSAQVLTGGGTYRQFGGTISYN